MNLTDQLETERTRLQSRIDALLADGAECLVKDGETIVTHFYVDGLEVLLPQPFFDRSSGELIGVTWWCWLREVHFEAAMQRSHLFHARTWEWHNDRNVSILTDDHTLLISALDPPEVDKGGNAVWQEWLKFKRDNPWLKEAVAELRETYMNIAKEAVG